MPMKPLARDVVHALVFVAAYVACAAYARLFIARPGDIALYWPASGLALALVVTHGPRWALLVPLSMWIAHLGFQPGRDALLPYAMASGLAGALAGGWVARRKPVLRPGTVAYGFRILEGGTVMAVVGAIIGGWACGGCTWYRPPTWCRRSCAGRWATCSALPASPRHCCWRPTGGRVAGIRRDHPGGSARACSGMFHWSRASC